MPGEDDIQETPNPETIHGYRRMIRSIHEAMPRVEHSLQEVRSGLYGADPNKPHEGMVARVAALEKADAARAAIAEKRQAARDKVTWLALTASFSALAIGLKEWIKQHILKI